MIQVWTINILVMRSRGRTEKSQNGQKHQWTKAPKEKNQTGQNLQKRKHFNTQTNKVYDPIITWYRCGQSKFSSCDHVGRQKSQNGQKHHITKAINNKNQSGQNPQKGKYFNTPTIKVYNQMITWYKCGQATFSSCDHVGGQRKAKIDKSTILHIPQRIKIKADKTKKRENILILQQSRCTIKWSHDTGVDNQHSRHAITCPANKNTWNTRE